MLCGWRWGAPAPAVRPPCWAAWPGAQSSHSCGRASAVNLFSNVWVSHLRGVGWEFITSAPPPSPWVCSLYLRMWNIFLVGSSLLLLMVFQNLVVILVSSGEQVSSSSFYPTALLIKSATFILSLDTWSSFTIMPEILGWFQFNRVNPQEMAPLHVLEHLILTWGAFLLLHDMMC